MKIIRSLKKFAQKYKKIFINEGKNSDIIIPKEFRSHEYEKKNALIIKDTETVKHNDLKYVVSTKLDTSNNNDLFSTYRLDFHSREALELFKKKYKSLIL